MKNMGRAKFLALLFAPLAVLKRAAAQTSPVIQINLSLTAMAEVPTGAINGGNSIFTLSREPMGNTQLVFRNGLCLFPSAGDYTISGSVITFGTQSIPQPGDSLVVSYWVRG